jgi:hypothetical protein
MGRSPFRDDVAAAQARAERLEAENHELRARLAEAMRPAKEANMRRAGVVMLVVAVMFGGLVALVVAMRTHTPDDVSPGEAPRDLRGIATASSTAADGPRANPDGARAKPLPSACRCEPGDPLCSCL